jgi:hypothetical protein
VLLCKALVVQGHTNKIGKALAAQLQIVLDLAECGIVVTLLARWIERFVECTLSYGASPSKVLCHIILEGIP